MFYTNAIVLPKNGLQSFAELLATIEMQIASKNLNESEIFSAKLAPDMFDFSLQIKRLIGQSLEMAETFSFKKSGIIVDFNTAYSLAEYKNFITQTIDFLNQITEDDIVNPESKEVRFFWLPGKKIVGSKYLLTWAVPNFYFHLATAYDILRNQGFEIGKAEYLGSNFGMSLEDDE